MMEHCETGGRTYDWNIRHYMCHSTAQLAVSFHPFAHCLQARLYFHLLCQSISCVQTRLAVVWSTIAPLPVSPSLFHTTLIVLNDQILMDVTLYSRQPHNDDSG